MKREDMKVFWINENCPKIFPRVKMRTCEISNRKNRVATLTFEFGNKKWAAINLDNVKYFEFDHSCSEAE